MAAGATAVTRRVAAEVRTYWQLKETVVRLGQPLDMARREIGSLGALLGLSHGGAFLQSQVPLQTETTLMFSLPVFFRLIQVSAGMNTNAPGWVSYSLR
jgi:hypothetical protein